MGMAQLQAQLGKLQEHIIRNLLKDPFLWQRSWAWVVDSQHWVL